MGRGQGNHEPAPLLDLLRSEEGVAHQRLALRQRLRLARIQPDPRDEYLAANYPYSEEFLKSLTEPSPSPAIINFPDVPRLTTPRTLEYLRQMGFEEKLIERVAERIPQQQRRWPKLYKAVLDAEEDSDDEADQMLGLVPEALHARA